jgi:TolA-binding protein
MRRLNLVWTCCIIATVICAFVLSGCGGTAEEATKAVPPPSPVPPQPSATEIMQQELKDLRALNDSCKEQLTRAELEKSAALARALELQNELADLKSKIPPPAPPPPPKPAITNMRESYLHALELFNSRKYKEASDIWQSLLDGGIERQWQDNCIYWMGECAYGQKHYKEAIEHFQKVFTFKISEKKDESQIMIANSYLAMGDKEKAREEYQTLLEKFPSSPYAKKVKARLGHF